jgi:hypothetical protein
MPVRPRVRYCTGVPPEVADGHGQRTWRPAGDGFTRDDGRPDLLEAAKPFSPCPGWTRLRRRSPTRRMLVSGPSIGTSRVGLTSSPLSCSTRSMCAATRVRRSAGSTSPMLHSPSGSTTSPSWWGRNPDWRVPCTPAILHSINYRTTSCRVWNRSSPPCSTPRRHPVPSALTSARETCFMPSRCCASPYLEKELAYNQRMVTVFVDGLRTPSRTTQ